MSTPATLVEMSPSISWIAVAPVKGLALAYREEVELEAFGVRDNRRFHLIGEEGRLLNGKQLGPLVQVKAEWDEDRRVLTLRFPDGKVVSGEIELGEEVSTSFYRQRDVEGRIVSGPWTAALSDFVGKPLRLVQPHEPGAAVDRGQGAVSILSTASLERLREQAGIARQIDARRFRMLFGVEGVGPHEEDTWLGRRVRVGQAEVELHGNVGRCLVTSRHPDSGVRDLATLDMLADYRGDMEATERLPFGVWGCVTQPGVVRVGDPVVV
jgi:uncharacterized protein YcbX